MNNNLQDLKNQAKNCLSEMHIKDGNAFINNLLFELVESDDKNLELKFQILNIIKEYLKIR